MPRFFFHLFNDVTSIDREGMEFPDVPAAMSEGARLAREMAAESVREGRLSLGHRIEITDEQNNAVGTVAFRDVVEVRS